MVEPVVQTAGHHNQSITQSPAEEVWTNARSYVNRKEKMLWNIMGQDVKPTYLDLFKIYVDGDMGGIANPQEPHGAAEALIVDIFEIRESCDKVLNIRTIGALHEYLIAPSDAKSRVFMVNETTSGVVGLLGAPFGLNPQFFSNQLALNEPEHQRLPSVIAACGFATIRYHRADEAGAWVANRISVCAKPKNNGGSDVFVLLNDHEARVTPILAYKMFSPWLDSIERTSVSDVLTKQIMYPFPDPNKDYSPHFTVLYTALSIAISESMNLLVYRDRAAMLMLNGLNCIQFATTKAKKDQYIAVMREVVPGIGQPGVPERLRQIVEGAELSLQQFEYIKPRFTSPLEQEKVDLTSKDLEALIRYAERVAANNALVCERTGQVFGAGGWPAEEEEQYQPREGESGGQSALPEQDQAPPSAQEQGHATTPEGNSEQLPNEEQQPPPPYAPGEKTGSNAAESLRLLLRTPRV